MRIIDWSSDVCSSDLVIGKLIGTDVELNVDLGLPLPLINRGRIGVFEGKVLHILGNKPNLRHSVRAIDQCFVSVDSACFFGHLPSFNFCSCLMRHMNTGPRSEEHTSELQSLMRISYAVFCLTKK